MTVIDVFAFLLAVLMAAVVWLLVERDRICDRVARLEQWAEHNPTLLRSGQLITIHEREGGQ